VATLTNPLHSMVLISGGGPTISTLLMYEGS